MSNQKPSLNPSNNDTLTGLLRQVFLKLLQNTNTAIPAKVINFKKGPPAVVQVQPMIKMVGTQGLQMSRAQIAEVPVYYMGAGGYIIYFNIKPGDQGLLLACDRDISIFTQSGNEAAPNTYRVKSFSDSFFLPLVMRDYTIANEDEESMVIQDLAGDHKIAIWSDRIKVTGRVDVIGDLNVEGNIIASGDITPNMPIPP